MDPSSNARRDERFNLRVRCGCGAQLMQASLSATASAQYRPLQSLESKLMLQRLLNLKDDFAYKSEITL